MAAAVKCKKQNRSTHTQQQQQKKAAAAVISSSRSDCSSRFLKKCEKCSQLISLKSSFNNQIAFTENKLFLPVFFLIALIIFQLLL
jgi:hypothetical protein